MNTQSKELSFKGQNIYVGIDVHLKSWSVTLMSETALLRRFSQSPDPDALHAHLVRNYPGAEYHSVYEAGFCGFWIHHRFVELGMRRFAAKTAAEYAGAVTFRLFCLGASFADLIRGG